ncbi:MAG: NAD(+) synthase, partial [Pelagibacteraceae bacterium]
MNPSDRVEFIKKWIINYVNSMPRKATSLVVGVSGGIDSAVVSTISSMTGIKTFVLSMPIKQIKYQDDLSKLHCNWLTKKFQNTEYLNINLDGVFSEFEKTVTKNKSEHAFANSRA